MTPEPQILHDATGLSEHEKRILATLAGNARMTNAALSEAVDIPPSTCLLRVQNLRERDVIRGFHTHVDRHALGLHLEVLVAVELAEQSQQATGRLLATCRTLDHVMAVMQVSGDHHFLLQVYATSTDQLLERVITPLEALPQVRRTNTTIVFDHWRRQSCLAPLSAT
ncbi:Lrp/AsnC family transcriptional regulator [Streptosporangium sp. NPDC000396]|uniref:Lrp/AsnC family transcriptional regulator n=1 Tax=Streptosporangium sp. NPDC000396 TaxID=3366185 RepID=UPI0036C2DDDF